MTVMEHTKAATLDLTKHGLHNVKEVVRNQATNCCLRKKRALT